MSMRDVFSERLKALRKEIGISQEAFAQALGVARATLGYYEKGDRLPDIGFLDLLNEKTGCSIEYLMGYSENMNRSNDDLGAITGLSDKAIEALNGTGVSEVVNFLLEHPRFIELVETLAILSYHHGRANDSFFDAKYRDYKAYQLSCIVQDIAKDAYASDSLAKEPGVIYPGFDDEIQGLVRAGDELWKTIGIIKRPTIAGRYECLESKAAERAAKDPVYRFYRRMTED